MTRTRFGQSPGSYVALFRASSILVASMISQLISFMIIHHIHRLLLVPTSDLRASTFLVGEKDCACFGGIG